MKVRVLAELAGSPWQLGKVIDLPDAEAQQWIAAGVVEPVKQRGPAHTR